MSGRYTLIGGLVLLGTALLASIWIKQYRKALWIAAAAGALVAAIGGVILLIPAENMGRR